jgi:hypothetical protein
MKYDIYDSGSYLLDPVVCAVRLLPQALAGMAMIVVAGCRAPFGTSASSGGLPGT